VNLAQKAQYACECDWIIREYGAVCGAVVYRERHRARWRARYVIRLLVELGMHERSELVEHTNRGHGGYVWAVEYVPRVNVGRGRA
jgi:hypothetical protein